MPSIEAFSNEYNKNRARNNTVFGGSLCIKNLYQEEANWGSHYTLYAEDFIIRTIKM